MALDAVKNFGKVTVSTGYGTSDTSIVLTSGNGAKLPAPATDGSFNLVWWNSTDYGDPADDPNVEIVRCTARSTDTLTVTRAQEGTTAANHNTAGKTYTMILPLTAKMITDIAAAIAAGSAPTFATPNITLASSAAAGSATTVIKSDSTIAAFDTTAPVTQDFGDSASVGSAAFAARRDHKHGMPSTLRNIVFPASCFETRVASGWASFVQTQGTNFDYGELDFIVSAVSKAIAPAVRFSNWNAGNINVRIGWKANATSGAVVWTVSFLGLTPTPQAFDSTFTDHNLSAATTAGSAEYLTVTTATLTVSELANNDTVIMKIARKGTDGNDNLAATAKLIYVELEYTEAI